MKWYRAVLANLVINSRGINADTEAQRHKRRYRDAYANTGTKTQIYRCSHRYAGIKTQTQKYRHIDAATRRRRIGTNYESSE